jgi:hypothetical protein
MGFPRREKGWRRLELCSAVFGCCVAELTAAFSLRCSLTSVGSGGVAAKESDSAASDVARVCRRCLMYSRGQTRQAREADPLHSACLMPELTFGVIIVIFPFPAFLPVNPRSVPLTRLPDASHIGVDEILIRRLLTSRDTPCPLALQIQYSAFSPFAGTEVGTPGVPA